MIAIIERYMIIKEQDNTEEGLDEIVISLFKRNRDSEEIINEREDLRSNCFRTNSGSFVYKIMMIDKSVLS